MATSIVRSDKNFWLVESISPSQINMVSVEKVHFSSVSKFQKVDILELGGFGRTLVLDEKIQSTEFDEFVYHESLVHPAMLLHPNPTRVLIAGGGEGATAREVLRHRSVQKCVMVDIDGECVEMCKKYLPGHHQGSFDDERFELVIDDAKKYLEECDSTFDVIILDLADPLPDGPCYLLYTKEFYELVRKRLTTEGVMVTQSGPSGIHAFSHVFSPINRTLREVFTHAAGYMSHVPSFSDMYGFNIASNFFDVSQLSVEEIDERIRERIPHELRYYDGSTHKNMFALSKFVRQALASETHIITPDQPAFMPA